MAILLILGFWVLLRAAFWPAPISMQVLPPLPQAQASVLGEEQPALIEQTPMPALNRSGAPGVRWMPAPVAPQLERPLERPIAPELSLLRTSTQSGPLVGSGFDDRRLSGRRIVGHTLLLAAAFSQMDVASELLPYLQGTGPRQPQIAAREPFRVPVAAERFARETAAPSALSRWSMDAWALWREDDNSPLLSGRPAYGRSQIGAVLRYRLAPSSAFAPQAHLRASGSLAGPREEEVALGISARPLPQVPVRLTGEARLRDSRAGSELRAAAFAVSEFPPLALPGQTTGEAYVAAGYVTGDQATGFVDGQARITREFASGENFRLSAGGGAWGGAQEGSERLDIGPSASVSLRLGPLNTRLSADYRVRVAGDAQPASGPAVTISAGF